MRGGKRGTGCRQRRSLTVPAAAGGRGGMLRSRASSRASVLRKRSRLVSYRCQWCNNFTFPFHNRLSMNSGRARLLPEQCKITAFTLPGSCCGRAGPRHAAGLVQPGLLCHPCPCCHRPLRQNQGLCLTQPSPCWGWSVVSPGPAPSQPQRVSTGHVREPNALRNFPLGFLCAGNVGLGDGGWPGETRW